MAQCIRATKPGNLSSIWNPYGRKRDTAPESCPLTSTHAMAPVDPLCNNKDIQKYCYLFF